MKYIGKISLIQFRNYESGNYEFPQRITCITGPNGSGKTNLLDAVYYLCYTKSYFGANQQNSVQNGKEGFRVSGVFEEPDGSQTISCKWLEGKKEVSRNGVEYEKVTDHIGAYSAVMIAPDDIELINGYSEQRRKWMDAILGQADREYLERLMRYQRVLQQRNAWLKLQAQRGKGELTELEYYNQSLAQDGTYLYERRRGFLQSFLPLLSDYYHQLSGGDEPIHVTYTSDLQEKPLQIWLEQNLDNDMRYQRTLRGVHRDDWELQLNGMSLKQFGSQGQKKSFLFALKLGQYAWLTQTLGHTPVLLLDDIFEKLDQSRMEALLRIIRGEGFGQVILTDTHAGRIREAFGDDAELTFIHLQKQ